MKVFKGIVPFLFAYVANGLNDLQTFLVTPSNCSRAIQKVNNLHSNNFNGSLHLSRLKLLNIGSGTTGTHLTEKIFCEDLHFTNAHWIEICNEPKKLSIKNYLYDWSIKITKCLLVYEKDHTCVDISNNARSPLCAHVHAMAPHISLRPQDCLASKLLSELERHILAVLRRFDSIQDTPVDFLYGELLSYISPDVLAVQTLRDPEAWVLSRFKTHPYISKICRPEYAVLPGVKHPFDLPGCLRHVNFVGEALEMVPTFSPESVQSPEFQRIKEAYVAMTSYNSHHAKKLHMVCLWDGYVDDRSANSERVRREILQLWNESRGM